MKRNILIIEDKKVHIEALCKIIDSIDNSIEMFCAYNETEAYKIALEHHIHLFLVDIILNTDKSGDVSGLRFVQEIRNVKKYSFTPVIFITSLEDPKLYSYSQLHCFGYIEKPFRIEQVKECVLKALNFPIVSDDERYVYFRKEGIVYSKRVRDIIYIEISRRKILIHCVNDELEIPYKTSEEIMHELDSDMFIKCSRYAIINKEYIDQIDYANRFVKLKHIDQLVEIGIMVKNKFRKMVEDGVSNS